MGIAKLSIHGNDYIGAWSIATDKFFMLGSEVNKRTEDIVRDALNVSVVRALVGGSSLLGVYVTANSNGVLVPNLAEHYEVADLRKELKGTTVEVLHTDLNALKNNILTNDKIAIINPNFSVEEEKIIRDVLDVEIIRMTIGGFHTVGANNILTNKGMVINNRATDEEIENVEGAIGMKVEQSTANLGSVNIGLCAVANSYGIIAGDLTSGYELARMAESLNLE
ncbi:Translation initiation factor 6 [uncultured archaeon]|nr:Translation initiation factor 6 [uncultured archaeon]